MRFHIITIFPEMMRPFVEEGVLGRAKNLKDVIDVNFYNPRDYTTDKHKTVDDKPFGGGPGMVLKALPVLKAVESALEVKVESRKLKGETNTKILILSPRGKKFDQKMAKDLAEDYSDLVLISGRYEGIDARVKRILEDSFQVQSSKFKGKMSVEEVSVGGYILSGGELPAMIVVDAVSRQVPGVLGNEESLEESRTATGEMYTRPEVLKWEGKEYKVPEVLRSGNHAEIEKWKNKKSL